MTYLIVSAAFGALFAVFVLRLEVDSSAGEGKQTRSADLESKTSKADDRAGEAPTKPGGDEKSPGEKPPEPPR
jgi:hypothetical protein